jgi:hypothetical protein
MEFLTYALASVISAIGIIAGNLILIKAPEEKKPGMKYFVIINYFLFLLSAILSMAFAYINRQNLLFILPIVILISLFFRLKKAQLYFAYLSYSLMLWFFSDNKGQLLIFSAIIFAYGLAAGAIIFEQRNKKETLLSSALIAVLFILLSILLKLAL